LQLYFYDSAGRMKLETLYAENGPLLSEGYTTIQKIDVCKIFISIHHISDIWSFRNHS